MTTSLHIKDVTPAKPKRTLENRVNDLSWKDWLLFQKSFFHLSDDEALFGGLIQFFTKQFTKEGDASRVMSISVTGETTSFSAHGRKLFRENVQASRIGTWQYDKTDFTPFDFIIVDFRNSDINDEQLANAVAVRHFLKGCKDVLREGGFCVMLSKEISTTSGRFPLPWILSSLARQIFRLRDERIGLVDSDNATPTYINVLQAIEEIGPVHNELPRLQIGRPAVHEQWLKPKPKPRNKKEILHPAKFPEELVQTFLDELTVADDVVLDPMGGTGSTAVAALASGRKAIVIELGSVWAGIAHERVSNAGASQNDRWRVIHGDARNCASLISAEHLPVNYTITSPPYWRILHNPGMHVSDEGQKARQAKGLRTTYSESDADLGNIKDYRDFISDLASIYEQCADIMEQGSVLTVVTKNVKFERAQYPIAWDLVFRLCREGGRFEYAGNTFWCQDDVGLKPFGMGCDWISNILHNYCIHLRVRGPSATKI